MKRLLTLLALVLCSCAETFVGEEIARPNNENLPDLTAAFAEAGDTRTYIEDGKYLRWNEDDRLTAFYGNTLNRQYKFNGQTGDNSGTFSLVADGMLGTGNAFDHIYALYPYNADARITDEGVITLTLPETQSYAENSFGLGANTMVAVTENLEDTFLAFKNVGGYLKLKLYNAEGATIKSIEVKGNNGEKLAGEATLSINFGEAPILAMADDATTSVILNCGEGVALGTTAETATEFWVTLPATTFAEGLTITATDTEGGVFEKSTTNEVIIERNAIQPMAALEAECTPTGPADNEIWYTNGSTTEGTTPRETNVFGANIVSNTYDAAKECWVIKFDGKVTSIGEDAFYRCDSLTSVTIPNSVATIGDDAFELCRSLTSITIPDSVRTIGNYAFYGCRSLASVTIGNRVTMIGKCAFLDCDNLISANIGNSVTMIGDAAFEYCGSLKSVTIPDSVTSIGDSAFMGCSSLQEFNGKLASQDGKCLIVDGVLNSFAIGCGIKEYTIPENVETIGKQAFCYCDSLTNITIPDSVTTIGNSAFWVCYSLTSVTIPDSVTTIEYGAFGYCPFTSITIPDSVTSIGDSAFMGCSSLTNVTIPDSVTSIGRYVFQCCDSLTSITIPNSVTTIGIYAFWGCDSLTNVTIPDSVTSFGQGAFKDCTNLTSVYCKAITPPEIARGTNGDWAAFDYNASNRKIYVPKQSVELYKSAQGWCEYASCIDGKIETIKQNEIWYTSIDGEVEPNESAAFNATILSNTYDTDKECWVIKFDVDVTTIGYRAFSDCRSLTSITIPDSVTEIGDYAFSGCSGEIIINSKIVESNYTDESYPRCYSWLMDTYFTSLTIGNSVTSIGNYAFYHCDSLTNVTIPNSVTSIGENAFENCRSLSSVTIPDSVTSIGWSAFFYCDSLTSVYCKATIPPTLTLNIWDEWRAFDYNASGRKIYVPMGSVEAYKSAEGWSEYAEDIVGYNFEE